MNGAREKISQPMTSDNIQPLWELEIRVQGARIFPSSHLYYIYIYMCVYHMIYIRTYYIYICSFTSWDRILKTIEYSKRVASLSPVFLPF